MQNALGTLYILLSVLTFCGTLLILARNFKSARGEVVAAPNGADATRIDAMETRLKSLENMLPGLLSKSEPEQYRAVLMRLEEAESSIRTVVLKYEEQAESARRTANKLAARERRRPKAEPEAPPEEEEEGVAGEFPLLPSPSVNGHAPAVAGRRFGKFN